jgi:hypothetical protein
MDTGKEMKTGSGEFSGEFRGRIYDSIIDTVGATPLVRLKRMAKAPASPPISSANASSSTRCPRSRTGSV